jgi:hypothetical protein
MCRQLKATSTNCWGFFFLLLLPLLADDNAKLLADGTGESN